MKILYIDDRFFDHFKMDDMLVGSGYSVVHVFTSAEFLNQAKFLNPDLFIVDYAMPIDGTSLIRIAKKHHPKAHFIIFTSLRPHVIKRILDEENIVVDKITYKKPDTEETKKELLEAIKECGDKNGS